MKDMQSHQWQDDVVALLAYYESKGAQQGSALSHQDTADALGWSWAKVCSTIRKIKEHPELGWTVFCRRGPNPWVVLAETNVPMTADAEDSVGDTSDAAYVEGIWRVGRNYSATITAYNNTADKTTDEARELRHLRIQQLGALISLRGTLDITRKNHVKLADFLDQLLDNGVV